MHLHRLDDEAHRSLSAEVGIARLYALLDALTDACGDVT